MLTFNQSGLLLPDNKISSSIAELEFEFVTNFDSDKRNNLFQSLLKYNNEFRKACQLTELKQWVNGSFVTKKNNPGDIDLITFLNFDKVESLGVKLNDFKYPNSEKLFGVDAYIIEVYPENHKNRNLYLSDYAYWIDRFTKTRRIRGNKLSKGFLEIISK